MILFTALGALAASPLLFALGQVSNPVTAFLLVLAALMIASFYTSISGVVKADLFPTEVRALGVGLTYAVANAIFGGTAEYVALWLKSSGQEQWFAWYVSGIVAVGLAASLIMPDTRKYGYLKVPDRWSEICKLRVKQTMPIALQLALRLDNNA
jgi:hypothetical protein